MTQQERIITSKGKIGDLSFYQTRKEYQVSQTLLSDSYLTDSQKIVNFIDAPYAIRM